MPERKPLVLLCTDCPASRIVFHHLRREIGEIEVVEEDHISGIHLLRRRLKKLGPLRVAGQLLFLTLVVPVLRQRGAARIEEIKRQFELHDEPMINVHHVASVNSEEARKTLQALDPSLVIVCGTRIIGARTLKSIGAPIVNYHAGITPLYRGVHGGYWALAEGRHDLVGSTVHFVDEGIDTGVIVEQRTFEVTSRDSFATYQYLHVAAALPALVAVARRALSGEAISGMRADQGLPSKLRTHPTLWEYLRTAIMRGVR